jgi:hypothetical protein
MAFSWRCSNSLKVKLREIGGADHGRVHELRDRPFAKGV